MAEIMEAHSLTGKKCKSCGFEATDPVVSCTNCGSEDVEAKTFSGKGKVYTYTVVHVGFGHLAPKAPYVLAVIELEEGAKTMSIIEGEYQGKPVTESIAIDMPVRFDRTETSTGFIFKPA
ncbi:Zn-ribbon domain-containing OB-fold protein [Leptospira sp. SA-E8]|uniref:Zn-ribbon domain-containing OB-fold protein n=1 Tax=Leptospira sp. SA-E8 TaxID=3422259 RepID=UPI003EBE7EA8